MTRPKTLGTDVLHRLLTARGGGDLISSSSVAGFFAGAGISAYAAANTYQQAFADEWRDRGVVRHYCFSWSNWNGVGQSEGAQLADSARARGYVPLAPQQAILSLLIGLRFDERSLIVGLDGQHRRFEL